MFEILVTPGQVKEVRMRGRSQDQRDLDMDAYTVIRPLIDEMDRQLRARWDALVKEAVPVWAQNEAQRDVRQLQKSGLLGQAVREMEMNR